MGFSRHFATIAVILLTPVLASANYIELYIQGQGGLGGGSGEEQAEAIAGEVQLETKDFYKRVNGFGTGAQVGFKLLLFEAYVDYLQFVAPSGTTGKLLRGIAGLRGGLDLCNDDCYLFLRGGVGGMIGWVGSDSLNGAEVGKNPTGLTMRGGVGFLYKFAAIFGVGPIADVGYYYLFNGTIEPDPEVVADAEAMCDREDQACWQMVFQNAGTEGVGYETSSGIDYTVMLALRVTLGF